MPTNSTNLPITGILWLAASLPLVVLLLLLIWQRWSTSAAAPLALFLAVAVALLLFRTPLQTLAIAVGKGVWDAIFILYVIWPALILYNVARQARAFMAMQRGIRQLMPDRLLVVLAFAWMISSFIQSIAGFGTPIAVTTPLLVGLGVQPVYAVALPMIGAAWANTFGSLGTTWLATLTVVDIANPVRSLLYTTLLLWIPNLLGGLAIAWMYGRGWALKRALPAIVVVSLVHGGLQVLLVPRFPTIGNFFATSAALLATFALNRWSFYRQHDKDEPQNIFTEPAIQLFQQEQIEEAARSKQSRPVATQARDVRISELEDPGATSMPLPVAFAPYAVLAVVAVLALAAPPVRELLERFSVGLPFPATATGYGVSRAADDSYAAFAPLTHPGTLLLLSALVGYLLYRARGYYPAGTTALGILSRAAVSALPSTTAITALLLISKVMDHSGEITVLALGISAVAPRLIFLAASNFIGILGALVTSSNTASNVLFAPLQATAAQAEGIPVELAVASQSAGGAVGNAVAPSDALLGATVAGIPERLGDVLIRALPWTVITGLLIAAATVGLYLIG